MRARFFPERSPAGRRRAVLVLPQWNADAEGHVGLCQPDQPLQDLRAPAHPSLPRRTPAPELTRADYIVSANIGRTAQVCRQAVLDARRAIAWLSQQGYESIGILGTSLGSCLSMLTTRARAARASAAALNHISPFFADVVWSGLSTSHVREGLDGHVDPRCAATHLDAYLAVPVPRARSAAAAIMLVYAQYDLTFPVDLSRLLVNDFTDRGIPHQLLVLPCGHYSTGVTPFKWMDGLALCRFLNREL